MADDLDLSAGLVPTKGTPGGLDLSAGLVPAKNLSAGITTPVDADITHRLAAVPRPTVDMQEQGIVPTFAPRLKPGELTGTTFAAAPNQESPDVRLGNMVPEAAVPALSFIQRNVNEPLDRAAQIGAQAGRELGQDVVTGADLLTHPGDWAARMPSPYGPVPPVRSEEEMASERNPITMGAAAGIGSVAGGTLSDPRNWPFLASGEARPLLQHVISGGFGAMMGKQAIDTAQDLSANWDKYTPAQRAEKITTGGLSALMATGAGLHAVSGLEPGAGIDLSDGLIPREEASRVETPEADTVTPGPGAQNLGTGLSEGGSDLGALRESINRNPSVSDRIAAVDQAETPGASPAVGTFAKLQNIGQSLYDSYREPAPWTDFKDARGEWDGAIQRSAWEAQSFAKDIVKDIPDKTDREAITNYIQADGDESLLRARAAASDPKYAKGYEAAAKLGDAERLAAANISNYFDAKLQQAKDVGMLRDGIENYITQLWDRPNPVGQKLLADVDYGKLNTNPSILKKRILASYFDGEQAGFTPKNKDVGFLVATYDQAFNKAVASRAFIKSMLDGTAKDGRPLLAANGDTAAPVKDAAGDVSAYAIRPKMIDEQYGDYKPIDHPALRKWTWIGQDENGKPMFQRGELYVHPDIYKQLRNNLSTSALRNYSWRIGDTDYHPVAGLMNVGQQIKSTMLSFSGFHQVQESLHAAGHGVNPFSPDLYRRGGVIDLDNLTQMDLLEHGLQVASHKALTEFMDAGHDPLVFKIPGIGRVFQKYSSWLFEVLIPQLKMATALDILERNSKRYSDKLSKDQILELSANQANAAYGELNYNALGRSRSVQDGFRLLGLAPDFLEARMRFVGQAFKPYGTEQRIALLRLGAGLYVTARVVNAIANDGNMRTDEPFGVCIDGKVYSLRSVPGDVMHLVKDPRSFIYHRLNPATTLPVVQAITGRDEWGRKRGLLDQLKDNAEGWSPILIQKGIRNPEKFSGIDALLQAAGVESRPDKLQLKGKSPSPQKTGALRLKGRTK